MVVELSYVKMYDDVKEPVYATDGSACFDVYAHNVKEIGEHGHLILGTGLVFNVPKGYALMMYSRSGHGIKESIVLANGTGVIDSDYRGELMLRLIKHRKLPYLGFVEVGRSVLNERVAQLMLIPVPEVRLVEATEVDDPGTRGDGAFGSTGTH